MYKNHFGFRERPFKLVPNPAYLFLSKSHEEAIAHLTYAVSQGDGFVEITGEVGTGKTTICRAFLEGIDGRAEVACILNPKLDALQLLKAINEEFGIGADFDNTKDLIDVLNVFLMEKKAEGKRVILLIDEAQNLSMEVLEQLRLLSNLETNTSKLLQIILVGQPELGEKLDSYELRQLTQRITLRCYIQPLDRKETKDYIRHRIRIASRKSDVLFTGQAFRVIFRYSRGIPRLVNIACDRSLLTAFGLNRHKITGTIAKAAVRELSSGPALRRSGLRNFGRAPLVLGLIALGAFMVFLNLPAGPGEPNWMGRLGKDRMKKMGSSLLKGSPVARAPETETRKAIRPRVRSAPVRTGVPAMTSPISAAIGASEAAASKDESGVRKETNEGPSVELDSILKGMDWRSSRNTALESVVEMWGKRAEINPYLEEVDNDRAFFHFAAKHNGLSALRLENFNLVRKLNLPAILEFVLPDGLSIGYLALVELKKEKMGFRTKAGGILRADVGQVMERWAGAAFVLWKDFLDYEGTIPFDAPEESVITLKMLIHDIGFDYVELNPFYDEPTREAVEEVQRRHGLKADGIVGPLTKIVLYNEKTSLNIPHIVKLQ